MDVCNRPLLPFFCCRHFQLYFLLIRIEDEAISSAKRSETQCWNKLTPTNERIGNKKRIFIRKCFTNTCKSLALNLSSLRNCATYFVVDIISHFQEKHLVWEISCLKRWNKAFNSQSCRKFHSSISRYFLKMKKVVRSTEFPEISSCFLE